MTDITEYKIVRRVPDDETAKAGAITLGREQVALTIGDAEDVWDAMLNASPPPGEDLVERVAQMRVEIEDNHTSDVRLLLAHALRQHAPMTHAQAMDKAYDTIRAILAEIERKNDD